MVKVFLIFLGAVSFELNVSSDCYSHMYNG